MFRVLAVIALALGFATAPAVAAAPSTNGYTHTEELLFLAQYRYPVLKSQQPCHSYSPRLLPRYSKPVLFCV